MQSQSQPQPPPQVFVALDIEGLGDDTEKYPIVAVAFAVVSRAGKILRTFQTYMPCEVSEATIEPRCYREFWNNPKKCDPKVFAALQASCRNSTHRNMADAWRAVADEIDRIYEEFEDTTITWVTDCADYDVALVTQYIKTYAHRVGLRYDVLTNTRHRVEDCSSGMKIIRKVFPEVFQRLHAAIEAAGAPDHTHDCLDDAVRMAIKYVKFLDATEELVAATAK